MFIYSSNWQNNWRLLLFKLQSLFLPLSKFICHTVTFSFMHITGVVWPMIHSFCFGIITNIIKNLLHILDFTSVYKWKSYNQNSDFVPFSKFTFVTVWHEKFDSIMSEIGFWKRCSDFLHNVIHIQDSQKYLFCKIWSLTLVKMTNTVSNISKRHCVTFWKSFRMFSFLNHLLM